jgi:hypothetical protein
VLFDFFIKGRGLVEVFREEAGGSRTGDVATVSGSGLGSTIGTDTGSGTSASPILTFNPILSTRLS